MGIITVHESGPNAECSIAVEFDDVSLDLVAVLIRNLSPVDMVIEVDRPSGSPLRVVRPPGTNERIAIPPGQRQKLTKRVNRKGDVVHEGWSFRAKSWGG